VLGPGVAEEAESSEALETLLDTNMFKVQAQLAF
jgi:hypothetical protein